MVPMMEVRRKFFAGTISVFSLECHSSFIRLLKWSREELAAILNGYLCSTQRDREREVRMERGELEKEKGRKREGREKRAMRWMGGGQDESR